MTKVKVRRVAVALLVAFVGAVPLVGSVAGAQTAADKNKVDQQIDAAKQQVDTESAEEQNLLSQIDASTARKKDLDAKVAAFDTQIAGVQRQLDTAQSKVNALETQQRAVEGKMTDARTSLDAAKQDLARQAIAAYTGQSEAANYAAMLLGSANVADLASKRSYIRAVVG